MTAEVEYEVVNAAHAAHEASQKMAGMSSEHRDAALNMMADALRQNAPEILAANKQDVEQARAKQTPESLIDRLLLTEARIEDMASALQDLVSLPDPVGIVLDQRTLYNDLELTRMSVPLGVVAVVYEARPNVTADAAGICLKSGNACILRGGSLAAHSNAAIVEVLADAAREAGLPEGCIVGITSTERSATDALMKLRGLIDVLIPRGGAGLIQHCVEHSLVPVIETGTGNCHIYLHKTANQKRANEIVVNAKCRRYGVCNACESLLVDADAAAELLPEIMRELVAQGVLIHADEQVCDLAAEVGLDVGVEVVAATDDDWGREYLAPEISIKCVSGVDEAIAHINRYGTHHSEAIVADDHGEEGNCAIEAFLRGVDAAAVYANASTAFTDGGQFGLGAEIGISTQKLHARGPFALEALTTYKYLVRGTGQVRA
ncbi:glutamate-5-semialdehyde dehydrogenase [Adlercreutzia agrestimuris]|uniref:glutamate-5-semialdehyde dehydrogenase n=1 Tax=Adlercreutzia agrestimuris TaxID=2941324 RepID=UPI00203A472E|nr:glutamate-5-semialdehyde dehydrogenase [Adlercreutzia agrestimuris]